jgi:hypothetical protein
MRAELAERSKDVPFDELRAHLAFPVQKTTLSASLAFPNIFDRGKGGY